MSFCATAKLGAAAAGLYETKSAQLSWPVHVAMHCGTRPSGSLRSLTALTDLDGTLLAPPLSA